MQTSQRVVDVILRAFEAVAASQGYMNNLTFGDEKMGYYETIAGGAGAVSTHAMLPGENVIPNAFAIRARLGTDEVEFIRT